ncbi:hypothetical protein QJS66_09485 [Kocuria rhizophila]|nr:hypothetical protein QJS66_09485 [Kocuria rhizophila]
MTLVADWHGPRPGGRGRATRAAGASPWRAGPDLYDTWHHAAEISLAGAGRGAHVQEASPPSTPRPRSPTAARTRSVRSSGGPCRRPAPGHLAQRRGALAHRHVRHADRDATWPSALSATCQQLQHYPSRSARPRVWLRSQFFPVPRGPPSTTTGTWSSHARTATVALDRAGAHGLRRGVHLPPTTRSDVTTARARTTPSPPVSRIPAPRGYRRSGGWARAIHPGPRHARGLRRVRGPRPRSWASRWPGPRTAGLPQHYLVTEHPQWFTTRADGSIASRLRTCPRSTRTSTPTSTTIPRGSPPRRCASWSCGSPTAWTSSAWTPHTKPRLWEWLIARVREEHPDTVFLAEAFT